MLASPRPWRTSTSPHSSAPSRPPPPSSAVRALGPLPLGLLLRRNGSAWGAAPVGSLAGALRRALFSSRPDPPEARSGAADAEMGPAPPPTEAREGCGSSSRTPRLRVLQLCHRGELKTPAAAAHAAAVRAWLKRARLQAELVQVEAELPAAAAEVEPSYPPRWPFAGHALGPVNAELRRHSAAASLVLLPLPPPPPPISPGGHADGALGYLEALRTLARGLPPTAFARSNGSSVITTEI